VDQPLRIAAVFQAGKPRIINRRGALKLDNPAATISLSLLCTIIMSFDQLSSLEAGRRPSPGYTDDPEFQRVLQDMKNKLFKLSGNNQRLRGELGHLGTRRDTPRVRERVHELLEESRDLFKEVGEGVKKVQSWEDVTVCSGFPLLQAPTQWLTYSILGNTKISTAEDISRIPGLSVRVSGSPAAGA
jgi:hypothetical protein